MFENIKIKNLQSLYITSKNILKKEKYFIKYYDELKDEIICFVDNNENIKIYSSICPHFGGEIYYDNKNNWLRCKWHDWKFCKDTGKCLSYPIKLELNPYDFEVKPEKLKNYDVKLESDKIYLIYEKE